MSTNPLMQTIEALAKEKGIEPDVVVSAMEEAVLTASRKYYKAGEDLKAKLNPETGQIELFGRIAAQTAKQVIFQKVREAERENVYAEYNQRIGDVVTSLVKRFETGDIICELGRIEAILP